MRFGGTVELLSLVQTCDEDRIPWASWKVMKERGKRDSQRMANSDNKLFAK